MVKPALVLVNCLFLLVGCGETDPLTVDQAKWAESVGRCITERTQATELAGPSVVPSRWEQRASGETRTEGGLRTGKPHGSTFRFWSVDRAVLAVAGSADAVDGLAGPEDVASATAASVVIWEGDGDVQALEACSSVK